MQAIAKSPVPTQIRTLCAFLLLAITTNGYGSIDLRLIVRNGSSAPKGTVVLRSVAEPQPDRNEKKREIAFEGNTIAIDEAPGSRWELSIDAPGYWTAPSVIEFPAAEQRRQIEIPLWTTTTLRGRLRFPEKETAPKSMSVGVESPPHPTRNREIARGTKFTCESGADGAWSCILPATTLDLVVRVDGYAPVYRWDVALRTEQPTNLGELKLHRGASVVAWLDPDSAKSLDGPAIATLSRMIADEASPRTARLRAPVAEAHFDSRGVVQLLSLPAGTYVLTVTAKGFAPARAFPIEVFAGRETALRKVITLEPPMTVRLQVRPPKDPAGAPWHVEFHRLNDFGTGRDLERAVRATVDADGVVAIADQTPGAFHVSVTDAHRNVFARRELDLRDGAQEQVLLDVPLVSVRGKVLLGDEPLAADLWFGGRNASISVKLTSNADGAFEGALPQEGPWTVQVASRSPAIETLTNVDVKATDEITIRLPDTVLEGAVVDAGGGPLDMIDVTAFVWGGRAVTVRAERDGTFAFRGLPVAAIGLQARDLRTSRQSRRVEVQADPSAGKIVLRLQSVHQVSGRVLSRGVPVIGASIVATALSEGNSNARVQTVSNEVGSFDLDVPDAARQARIVVSAPGRTLQNFDVPLTDAPLILDIEPIGGTLELFWPKGRFPQVDRAGVPLMLADLSSWARRHGELLREEGLRIPNLAPGVFRICVMVPASNSSAAPRPQCREGILAPAGTLRLDLSS